jgi:glycosyltransferase involved in cell wall biosynthesis
LSFILLNKENSEIEKFLIEHKIDTFRIKYEGKKDIPKIIFKVITILLKLKPNVVHSHMRDADLIGQIAAWFCRVKKRIHTRHFATYNIEYHHNAVKIDKLINRLSTHIIAISENVKNVLLNIENVPQNKISVIHHGFDLTNFNNIETSRIENLKQKYFTENKYPVIGIIARFTELKGHKYIISALEKTIKDYPNSYFLFANAVGDDKEIISNQLKNQLPQNSYLEIQFEKDIFAFYKILDFHIHVPINKNIEAFGQTYVEALASGVPSVFTPSGVAPEFIENKKNAMVVDFCNSEQIYSSLKELIENDNLRNSIITKGKFTVEKFGIESFIKKLEDIYE